MNAVAMTADSAARLRKAGMGTIWLIVATGLGFLTPRYGFMAGLGTFIFGVAGIMLVVMAAVKFSGRAPCPSCGDEMRDLPVSADGVVCRSCGVYARCVDRTVAATPEDYIATKPTYRFELTPGQQPDFPMLCADCGAPATRTLSQLVIKTGVIIPGVGRTAKRWSIDVPCCAVHQKDTASYEGDLRVKSHRFWATAIRRDGIERPAA